MKENLILDKSYAFANLAVRLYKRVTVEQKEFVLSKQFLRSATAIGALLREAEHAQSKADFLSKVNISLKEANETMYWLDLLKDNDFITLEQYNFIFLKAEELVKILVSITKTTKRSLNK